MKNIFNLSVKKGDLLKLQKTKQDLWLVKKNLSVVYVGTEEKCLSYMQRY